MELLLLLLAAAKSVRVLLYHVFLALLARTSGVSTSPRTRVRHIAAVAAAAVYVGGV